jgi:hypothetical protein
MQKPTKGLGSVDHTTSRRRRAGSRRNKRLRNVGTFLTDLTHLHRYGCRPGRPLCPPMLLTRCEQRWVRDVQLRQEHVHLPRRTPPIQRTDPNHIHHAHVVFNEQATVIPSRSVLERVRSGLRKMRT